MLQRAEENEGFYETFDEEIFDTSVKMTRQILRIKTYTRKLSMLTLRRLMSYIYIYIYIYIYMEHSFLMFLDHTQRRSTVGRTPLDE